MNPAFEFIPYAGIRYDWFLDNFFFHNTMLVTGAVFLVLITLVLFNWKDIRQELKLQKKTLAMLLLVLLVGFYLRNSYYVHGEATDGFVYGESAKNIVGNGIYAKDCIVGNWQECKLYEQVLAPPGYPFLIALSYYAFGVNSINASIISAFLSTFTLLIVFLIGKKLANERVGLFSTLVLALFPLDLVFANTGNVRPTGIFFICLSLLFYLIALEKNKTKNWMLVAMTLSFSIYVRHENSVMLAPMLLGFFLIGKTKLNSLLSLKNAKKNALIFLPAIVVGTISQIPVQYWIIKTWIFSNEKIFSLSNAFQRMPEVVSGLLLPNSTMYTFGYIFIFGPAIILLFAISLYLLFKKEQRGKILFLLSLFFPYFLIMLFYMRCPQGFCSDYVRYMHPLVVPVSLLAGFSLTWLQKKTKIKTGHFLIIAGIMLLVSGCIPLHPTIFADKRLEIPFIYQPYFEAIEKTENNCTIITFIYLLPVSDALPKNSRKSINLELIGNASMNAVMEEINESSCTYFLDDGFCKRNKNEGCSFIEKIEKEEFWQNNNKEQPLILYKIKTHSID